MQRPLKHGGQIRLRAKQLLIGSTGSTMPGLQDQGWEPQVGSSQCLCPRGSRPGVPMRSCKDTLRVGVGGSRAKLCDTGKASTDGLAFASTRLPCSLGLTPWSLPAGRQRPNLLHPGVDAQG